MQTCSNFDWNLVFEIHKVFTSAQLLSLRVALSTENSRPVFCLKW